ncbi:hypothetical protein DFH06DRAFT_1332488 [Mycena polygramma]|nr:hypothetical protein DFH06DRAFT_1332488 [Mycena polygramma]
MILPPTTIASTEEIAHSISVRSPPFPGRVRGILFPTGAPDLVWVTVPTDKVSSQSTIADVVFRPWISFNAPEELINIDLDACALCVDLLPGRNPIPLKRAFCLYAIFWSPDVYGAVVRHTADLGGFEDMDEGDVKKVRFIVKRTIRDWARLTEPYIYTSRSIDLLLLLPCDLKDAIVGGVHLTRWPVRSYSCLLTVCAFTLPVFIQLDLPSGVTGRVWDPTWDAAVDIVQPQLIMNFASTCLDWRLQKQLSLLDLGNVPFSKDGPWVDLFDALDPQAIFMVGLRDPRLWRIVMEYVRLSARPIGAFTGRVPLASSYPRRVLIGSLPVELALEIASHLVLRDRTCLGATSVFWSRVAAIALQYAVRDLLAVFGLCHADIQFVQSITECLLAGPAAEYLMCHVPAELCPDSIRRVNFYCPQGTYDWVKDYFMTCAGARVVVWAMEFDDGPMCGSTRTCVLELRPGKTVKLFQSATDSAMSPLACSPYTPAVGALSHRTFWHGHPRSTSDMVLFPNQAYVHVSDATSRYFSMPAALDYSRLGYNLMHYYEAPHSCGSDPVCPHTVRSSGDRGCMRLSLSTAPFPDRLPESDTQLRWFLGARPCVMAANAALTSSRFGVPDPQYHAWTLRWRGLVAAANLLA